MYTLTITTDDGREEDVIIDLEGVDLQSLLGRQELAEAVAYALDCIKQQ